MNINTKNLVSITEANQNFSKVARLVDESGAVVILKNNVPRYLVMEFSAAEQEQLAAGTEDLGAWNKNRMQNADNFQMQVGGRWYTEKKDAGEALLQIRNELKLSMEDQKVGEYQGLTVGFHYSPFIECHIISLGQSIRIEMGSDARGNIQRMDHAISALPETVKKLEGELISLNAQRERAKEEVK